MPIRRLGRRNAVTQNEIDNMEFKMMKPVDVEVKVLRANLGDLGERLDYKDEIEFGKESFGSMTELLQAYPKLAGKYNGLPTLELEIDLETGNVLNWPKGVRFEFYDFKINDTGIYTLIGKDGKVLNTLESYVPECLGEGGYGDYLEFEIDEDAHIVNWEFDQDDFNELMEVENDED